MKNEYEYHSVFAPYIQKFIGMHQSQGFIYNLPSYELYRFDCFCSDRGIAEPVITRELFNAFAAYQSPGRTEGRQGRYSRLNYLRRFSLFMNMLQITCYYPSRLCSPPKKLPYFMTDSDVKEFFETLDRWKVNSFCERFLQMHQEYRVLFRLYACCGLRNAEGCELRTENIDLTSGVITVVHSKGDKDRLVYLPDDLRYLCCTYWKWLTESLDFIPEYFFPGRDPMTCIPKTSVCSKFSQIWSMTEASKHCDKKPTVHGFRHYFVCKRINTWTNEGVDLHCMMPYLCSYLGHSSPEETYYYYHAVEDSVQALRSKDTLSASVIPEVSHEEKGL